MSLTALILSAPTSFSAPSLLGCGLLGWLTTTLEPAVAAYAFRVYRKLGAQRVGWWLVMTFLLLALAHLVRSGTIIHLSSSAGAFDLIAVTVPLLLLVGLAHREGAVIQGSRAEDEKQNVLRQKEAEAQTAIAALQTANEDLLNQLAKAQQDSKLLLEWLDYRTVFTESPNAMCIFDLRSFRLLAINNAALVQTSYTSEELLGNSVQDLLPAADVAEFVQDTVRPAAATQARGGWRLRKKNGAVFNAELRAKDLKFAGCPARLLLISWPA